MVNCMACRETDATVFFINQGLALCRTCARDFQTHASQSVRMLQDVDFIEASDGSIYIQPHSMSDPPDFSGYRELREKYSVTGNPIAFEVKAIAEDVLVRYQGQEAYLGPASLTQKFVYYGEGNYNLSAERVERVHGSGDHWHPAVSGVSLCWGEGGTEKKTQIPVEDIDEGFEHNFQIFKRVMSGFDTDNGHHRSSDCWGEYTIPVGVDREALTQFVEDYHCPRDLAAELLNTGERLYLDNRSPLNFTYEDRGGNIYLNYGATEGSHLVRVVYGVMPDDIGTVPTIVVKPIGFEDEGGDGEELGETNIYRDSDPMSWRAQGQFGFTQDNDTWVKVWLVRQVGWFDYERRLLVTRQNYGRQTNNESRAFSYLGHLMTIFPRDYEVREDGRRIGTEPSAGWEDMREALETEFNEEVAEDPEEEREVVRR